MNSATDAHGTLPPSNDITIETGQLNSLGKHVYISQARRKNLKFERERSQNTSHFRCANDTRFLLSYFWCWVLSRSHQLPDRLNNASQCRDPYRQVASGCTADWTGSNVFMDSLDTGGTN